MTEQTKYLKFFTLSVAKPNPQLNKQYYIMLHIFHKHRSNLREYSDTSSCSIKWQQQTHFRPKGI